MRFPPESIFNPTDGDNKKLSALRVTHIIAVPITISTRPTVLTQKFKLAILLMTIRKSRGRNSSESGNGEVTHLGKVALCDKSWYAIKPTYHYFPQTCMTEQLTRNVNFLENPCECWSSQRIINVSLVRQLSLWSFSTECPPTSDFWFSKINLY